MNNPPVRVLLLEDQAADITFLRITLEKDQVTDFQVVAVKRLSEGLEQIRHNPFDVILLNLDLPDSQGLNTLEQIRHIAPKLPVVILSSSMDEEVAMRVVQLGAQDYVVKGTAGWEAVSRAIRYAVERQQAQIALQESETRYQQVLDTMQEGCQIIDFDWRYIYVNDVVLKQRKRTSEELLHHTMMEVYPGIEHTELFVVLRQCMEERTPRRIENLFVFPDGSSGWFELSIQPTQEGLFILSTDITERKQAKQALQGNEKRFRAMIENGLDDISLLDAEGKLIWESPSVVRNLGYAPSEHVGRDIFELMHPEDRGWTSEIFVKLIKEPGSRQHGVFRLRHSSGLWRWVEAFVTNLLDEPSVKAIVINYRDVTERKQAEEARNEAEMLYRALFEQSHDAIFILDLKGHFLAVNQRTVDMLGYSREELLKLSVKDISAESAQSQQVMRDLINGEHVPLYERLLRKKDGSIISVEINAELVRDTYGNPVHIQSIIRDITERRRAEIELQHRNEDLGLINAINELIVQGGNLEAIVNVLAKEMRHLFSSRGISLFMLSPDARWFTLQQYAMSSELTRKIEKLIGSTIPMVKIPIQGGGRFQRILDSGQGIIISDPKEIQNWLAEFVETEFLPLIARGAIRKLIPQIYKILNINSAILVPLISNGKIIGFLDVSSSGLFTSEDLNRIENISKQLTAAILRQQAIEKIQRSEEFLQSIQNALSASIAILDETGTVVRVNSAWRKFGEQNGLRHPEACIGLNYLDICDSATEPYAEEAFTVAKSIRAVIQGQRKEAWVEYPCHSPEEKRWFIVRITKFEDGNKTWVVLAHENITERKLAQDAIQRSEAILAQAGKMAHLGAWEIEISNPENLDDNPLRWSDEVYRIFGYEPGEAKASNDLFYACVHPDDRQKVQWAMSQAIAEKKPYEVEHRIIRPDGVERIVEEHADLIFDEHGRLLQTLGAAQDITERKKIEEDLKETSERFRTLFDASPEAIMLIDLHGDWPILDCNAAACTMNGYSRDELVGKSVDVFNLTTDDPDVRAEYLEKVRKAGILRYETSHRRKDGSIFPIEVSASIVTLAGREVVLGIDRDVTERKRTEEALRQSESKYRILFESNPVPMWIYDLETLRFLKVNDAAISHYGYSTSEFMSMTIMDIRPSEEVPLLLENIAHVTNGIDRAGVWHHIKKDGILIQVEIISHVVDFDGQRAELVLANDVTERKKTELEIQRRNEDLSLLDAVNQALNRSESLSAVITLVSERLKHIFKGYGATIYLLDADHQRLVNQNLALPPNLLEKIEKLFGFAIPRLQFDLQHTHPFQRVFETKKILVVNDLHSVQQHYLAFAEAIPLSPALHAVARKVMPTIQKLVGVEAEMFVPLISNGELVGVMDLGGRLPFTEEDVQRMEYIASQLTAAIQRKRTEEALRAAEEKYRNIFENATEGIFQISPDGQYLTANPALAHILGFASPKELMEQSVGPNRRFYVNPNRHAEFIRLMEERGFVVGFEFEAYRRDGSTVWISENAHVVRNERGALLYYEGVIEDITERKQAQAALAASEQRFRSLIENSADGITVVDQKGIVVYVSPSIERIVGYSQANAIGRQGMEYVHPEDRMLLLRQLVRWADTASGNVSVQYRFKHKDGSWRWLESTISHQSDDPTIQGLIFNYRDITERKQAEKALRESQMRFAGVVNSAMDAVISVDTDQRIVLFNPAAEQMFRCKAADAIGQSLERFIPSRYRAAHEKHIIRFGRTGDTSRDLGHLGTLIGLRGDGTEFPMEVSISHIEAGEQHLYTAILRDITERKQAEEQLRKLSLAVEQSASSIVITDTSGRIEYVNPKFTEITGYSLEEALGQNPRILKSGHTPPEVYVELWKAITAGKEWHGELQNRKKNGELYWESVTISPILNEQAETTHFIAVKEDISKRKQNEAEIIRHLTELEAVYVNGLAVGRLLEPHAIGKRIIQTFSEYLSWHHVTIRLRKEGSDELELVAFHLPHMEAGTTADEEQRMRSRVSRVGQGISGWVVQTGSLVRTSDLSKHPHYVHTYEGMQSGLYMPLKVGDHVLGVISVESEQRDAFSEQDERLLATLANQAATAFENARLYQSAQQEIWDRKIAEGALRQSEENYRRLARDLEERVYERTAEVQDLYDNAPCGYHSLNQDGVIIRVNQTELDWLGYAREEMIGHPIQEFITNRSQVAFKETFPAFKQNGIIRDLEIEMIRKNGSIFPTLVSATAIYDKDRSYLTSRSTLFDDTGRKHAMETLRLANSEMKRAMRMKDEFLANMSHELRTPLNAILGLSESLLEQTAGPINEKQQKYLGTVNESGRHLLELINDILDLAKIESGQIKLDPGKVNINTVCEGSLRMIKQLAQKKNQSVEVEVEKEIGHVWADERRLKQMIVNLLSNAVKFTPEGGQLGMKVYIDRAEARLLITIWDHGIGIREEDLKRLFRPFVQLDSSLSRESAGTGLGLALVAEMARLHGGSVSISSQLGQGSQFMISLPWDPAITADTLDKLKITGKIPIMRRTGQDKQTVLLVEDTDSVVLMVRDYLELSGYKVEVARDGLEGISKSIAVRPDLILMDVQMPGMDGLEATRRIRKETNFKNTPIIALTALAMPSDRENCLEAGMNDYFSKPINLKELVKTIQRHLPETESG